MLFPKNQKDAPVGSWLVHSLIHHHGLNRWLVRRHSNHRKLWPWSLEPQRTILAEGLCKVDCCVFLGDSFICWNMHQQDFKFQMRHFLSQYALADVLPIRADPYLMGLVHIDPKNWALHLDHCIHASLHLGCKYFCWSLHRCTSQWYHTSAVKNCRLCL